MRQVSGVIAFLIVADDAHICRLLEGIPLGVEFAAAWTRAVALDDIARELAREPSLLATTLHDMPERHRSMVTVFDQSWQMLSAGERAVLRQLSVFRGGCTRDATATVGGATLADLSNLVDKSWLRLRPDGRYELHELIRQYGADKLESEHAVASQESSSAVRQRHCAYFAAYLHTVLQTMNYQQTTNRRKRTPALSVGGNPLGTDTTRLRARGVRRSAPA